MKKDFLALSLICLVVMLSGCINEETSTTMAGTSGVMIESFGLDLEHPFPGQTVNLEARVRNIGDAQATNIQGELYLLGWVSSSSSTCGNLDQPNEEIGREGQECTLSWTVTTPTNIEQTQTYDVGAHIYYGYKTKTVTEIYAFSEAEFAKRMESGETITTLSTVKNTQNSDAPIHVNVRVQNVLKTGSSNVPITLEFTNVGGGNVRYDSSSHYFVIDSATVRINSQTVGSCSNIHLKGGRTGTCSVNINVPSGDELKLPIEVDTFYTYETSAETKIVVYPEFR